MKYAENSSKIMELEDEKESLKKKVENSMEFLKTKDEIIKNLISERDILRNSLGSSSNSFKLKRMASEKIFTNHFTNEEPTIVNTSSRNKINESIYRCQTQESQIHKTFSSKTPAENVSPIRKMVKNSSNAGLSTAESLYNKHYEVPSTLSNKTPKSFVKIIKNIFISDKK
jgi:hypothetical protein